MRKKAYNYLIIVLLFVGVLFSTSQAADNSQNSNSDEVRAESVDNEDRISISGEVRAGSVDNEVHIRINNNSEKAVIGLTAGVADSPEFVLNFQIEPKEIEMIAPNSSGEFTVHFDIAKDAPQGETHSVKFRLSTETGQLEDTEPEMLLTVVEAPKDEEDEKRCQEACGPVLKLVRITGPKTGRAYPGYAQHYAVTYKEGEGGFKFDTFPPKTYPLSYPHFTASLRITQAPSQIVLGHPFEFAAEMKKRTIYKDKDKCFIKGKIEGRDPFYQFPQFSMKVLNSWGTRAIGSTDLYAYCKSSDTSEPQRRVVGGLVEKEGLVSLRMIFTPEQVETPYPNDKSKRIYHYKVDYTSDGELKNTASGAPLIKKTKIRFYKKTNELGFLHPDEKPSSSTGASPFFISSSYDISSIYLYYDAIHEGGSHIASFPEYQWPPELKQPPRDERGKARTTVTSTGTGTGTGTGTISIVQEGEPGEGTGAERVQDQPEITDEEVRRKPIDPNTLDPNNPEVANYIKQWIATAQPPENAVPGSNWRYDQFGRVVGSGPGLKTTRTHDSVDYGGSTPEATVWSLRKKLDSIDHCTLEEYVVALLKNESIAHCRGRYGAVKDLKGLKLDEAKAEVNGAGFKYSFAPGSPAKDRDEEGTVERQKPGYRQPLKRGQTVKLFVHSAYVKQSASLPDFTNKPLADAKKWLLKNELTLDPKPGGPAPSTQLSGAVEKQDPSPGTRLRAGSKVALWIYSPYMATTVVPDVRTLSYNDAKRKLEAVGLSIGKRDAGKPGDRSLAETAQKQEPVAGTQVAKGQTVRVWFYGPYALTKEEQVAALNCSQYGKAEAYWDASKNMARCRCMSGYKWNGSRCEPTRETLIKNTNCRGIKGSYAGWNEKLNKPDCFCRSGYLFNHSKTECVPAKKAWEEYCSHKWPGTVAHWNALKKKWECNCPQGLVWDQTSKRCIRQTRRDRRRERNEQCEQLLAEIRNFVNLYRADPRNNSHLKTIIERGSQDARSLGCDPNKIAQALGTGGGGQEQPAHWQMIGISDCTANDVITTPGATPDANILRTYPQVRCAVCWDQVTYTNRNMRGPFCTYKTTPPSECRGGGNPGILYGK